MEFPIFKGTSPEDIEKAAKAVNALAEAMERATKAMASVGAESLKGVKIKAVGDVYSIEFPTKDKG
jgi:hypothetical protein